MPLLSPHFIIFELNQRQQTTRRRGQIQRRRLERQCHLCGSGRTPQQPIGLPMLTPRNGRSNQNPAEWRATEQSRSRSPLEPAFLPAHLLGVGTAGGGREVKGGRVRREPGRPGGVKLGGGEDRERRGGRGGRRWRTGSKLPPGASSPASPGILCPPSWMVGNGQLHAMTTTPDFVGRYGS